MTLTPLFLLWWIMAYRRRQGITRASTFKEEIHHQPDHDNNNDSSSNPSSSSSLAAQAIRASAAHRDSSSLSSAYAHSSFHSSFHHRSKVFSLFPFLSLYPLLFISRMFIIVTFSHLIDLFLKCTLHYRIYSFLYMLFAILCHVNRVFNYLSVCMLCLDALV